MSLQKVRVAGALLLRLFSRKAVDTQPTREDLRFARVMRALRQWRRASDTAAVEQPYRDALAKTLAEHPYLAEVPRSGARVM